MIEKAKPKVLIVEDETALLYALQAELSYGGYKTITALDGEEAVEKLKSEKPEVVILDLILPGEIDGFQVLEKMKKNPRTKDIPVIIISNLGDRESIEKGMKMGATDYLVKTEHTLEGILKKIKKILAK